MGVPQAERKRLKEGEEEGRRERGGGTKGKGILIPKESKSIINLNFFFFSPFLPLSSILQISARNIPSKRWNSSAWIHKGRRIRFRVLTKC